MVKKLFEVSTEIYAYVMAENEEEAREVGHEALGDQHYSSSDIKTEEVKGKDHCLMSDWEPESLVYGTDTDTTLAEAMKDLPRARSPRR